jgi:hypothetical protein
LYRTLVPVSGPPPAAWVSGAFCVLCTRGGRASLAATVLPLEASNTEIRQSLLDGSLGLGPPEGGARDRREQNRHASVGFEKSKVRADSTPMGLRPHLGASHGGRATVTFSLKTGRISKVGLKISLCYVLYSIGNTVIYISLLIKWPCQNARLHRGYF